MAVCRETNSSSLKPPQHQLQHRTGLPSAGMAIQGSALLWIPASAPVRVTESSTSLVSAPGRALEGKIPYSPPWHDGEHTDHTTDSSIHWLLSDNQYSFCFFFFFHILTCKKQTKTIFPCFSSNYWTFPYSSLILFSLRYEHSQKQVSSRKLDKLNYWKFTKGKGNKDLKHFLDFSLPQISSLFIQIIIKQA